MGTLSVEKRWILGVGRRSEARKTGIEGLYAGSKLVWRWEIRIHRGSAGKLVSKIRVAESGIINAVSTADHGVAQPFASEQFFGSVRKADARPEVLIVGLGAGGIRPVNQRAGHGRRNWNSRVSGIRDCEVQDGHGTDCFVSRSIYVVAQSEIKGEVLAELKIILDVPGIVIRNPAGIMR